MAFLSDMVQIAASTLTSTTAAAIGGDVVQTAADRGGHEVRGELWPRGGRQA